MLFTNQQGRSTFCKWIRESTNHRGSLRPGDRYLVQEGKYANPTVGFRRWGVDETIYAIGGGTSPNITLSKVEAYDPATDTWVTKQDMPTPRADYGISAVKGKIYMIGGIPRWLGTPFNIVEEYDTGFVTSVENNPTDVPKSFKLCQNSPNLFDPEASIENEVSRPARVLLRVMNVLGQEVRTLVDEDKPAGFHEVLWDGRDYVGQRMPSGVYLYRMEVQGLMMTRKMVLVE